jgi:hypothetical protein
MKTIKIGVVLFSASLLAVSCLNSEKTGMHEGHTTVKSDHDDSESLQLNNGDKWVVNLEMKPYILDAEELLVAFINLESTSYQELASQLKEKNSGLIKSCTMKGESHDALHKWLHPHIHLVNELEKENDPEKAKSLVRELHASFLTYHQYFK